jgi:hypothetical protein
MKDDELTHCAVFHKEVEALKLTRLRRIFILAIVWGFHVLLGRKFELWGK